MVRLGNQAEFFHLLPSLLQRSDRACSPSPKTGCSFDFLRECWMTSHVEDSMVRRRSMINQPQGKATRDSYPRREWELINVTLPLT
jgi:hypothetical protein